MTILGLNMKFKQAVYLRELLSTDTTKVGSYEADQSDAAINPGDRMPRGQERCSIKEM